MGRDLVVSERITIPDSEIAVAFARSGGPGGQNVNKVETKVELRWRPAESRALAGAGVDRDWVLAALGPRLTDDGDLVVTSSRGRTQAGNREDALAKLAEIVRGAMAKPKKRTKTKPSRASKKRRVEAKKRRSKTKTDRRYQGE